MKTSRETCDDAELRAKYLRLCARNYREQAMRFDALADEVEREMRADALLAEIEKDRPND